MAEQLRKLKEGKRYERPPSVERLLDPALAQTPEVISQRTYVGDKASPDFLPTECLVHLLRHAFRTGNGRLRDAVLNPLLKRCERILKNKIPDDRPSADALREAVLGKFTELVARDAIDPKETELDYYEIRFNDAFRKFRISCLRREKDTRVCLPLPVDADESQAEIDPACVSRLFKSTGQELIPEDAVTRQELYEAVDALPPDEKEAVVLHFVYGLKIESIDLNETTVATVCKVCGRTIGARLKRALQRLKEKF